MQETKKRTYDELEALLLGILKDEPTEEKIRFWVNVFRSEHPHPEEINWDLLTKSLRDKLYLYVNYEDPDCFDAETEGPEPGFSDERWGEIKWEYWNRYKKYLIEDGMKPAAIADIHNITDKILRRIHDPKADGPWNSRGMVVGYIQSGKTANYTGLICKAADAGYGLIIILAGTTNDLRFQTQQRIDEGFVGTTNDEGKKKTVGVGLISNRDLNLLKIPLPKEVTCLTDSIPDGDFKTRNAKTRYTVKEPTCLVVKKNSTILKGLNDWIAGLAIYSRKQGVVTDIPLLLIDDEADNASLNTKKYDNSSSQQDDEITAINKNIRSILAKFDKSAYIGYTATPYANVFIDPDAKSDKVGADIFPRNFIISMKRPPGYFGSDTVFGYSGGDSRRYEEIDKEKLFPGIVVIPDTDPDILIPPGRKNDSTYEPKEIPPSLQEAIKSFLLSCAVREIRNVGGKKALHNSMLIHVTRFTRTQGVNSDSDELQTGLSRLVHLELDKINEGLAVGDPELYAAFRELWNTSLYPKSLEIQDIIQDELCTDVTFEQVMALLPEIVLHKLKIRVLNGANKDVLDYSKHKNGLTAIVIGGDKLSRGLTLQGLTTTYFLRVARTYDSLLQMGRWFGFRSGYADLCRIYTTTDLIAKFRMINLADEHLRTQFMLMDDRDKTPENYGLKIIQNDPRFRITQLNKMRCGKKFSGNPYSGLLVQTSAFSLTRDVLKDNARVIEGLITDMNKSSKPDFNENTKWNYIWRNIPVETILKHMPDYRCHPTQQQKMGQELYEYVRIQSDRKENELSNWTVVLVNNRKNSKFTGNIGGLPVGYSIRNPPNKDWKAAKDAEEYTYSKKNIINDDSEEALDLTKEELELAYRTMLADYEEGKRKSDGKKIRSDAKEPDLKKKSGYYIRLVRSVKNGLLLIYPIVWAEEWTSDKPIFGLAYSFPLSTTALSNEYVSNKPYQQNVLGDDDE